MNITITLGTTGLAIVAVLIVILLLCRLGGRPGRIRLGRFEMPFIWTRFQTSMLTSGGWVPA